MKAKVTLPRAGKLPDPPSNENTNQTSVESALSKDELISVLERTYERCAHLSNGFVADAIPVLLFLAYAAYQDDPPEHLVLRLKDGNLNYCNIGAEMAPILQWLAASLHECHNEIDVSCMEAGRAVKGYRDGHRKDAHANSRSERSVGGAA